MSLSESELQRYVAIVEAGNLAAAARDLSIPRETLSRQLARLEARLGVRLLHRSTRRARPTEAGQELYRRARPIVTAIREAEDAVKRHDGVPRGVLRLTTPTGMATLLAPLLQQFLTAHPDVELEVLATGRHVDLVAEGFDVALRAGKMRDSSLIAKRLWGSRLIAVATPSYLDRCGRPETVDDLSHHECLGSFSFDERPLRTWPLLDGGTVEVSGRLRCNELNVLRDAMIEGFGIASLPLDFVQRALEDGEVEAVLPDRIGTPTAIYVVYPERQWLAPKVRAFVDTVSTWGRDKWLLALEPQHRPAT